MWQTENFRKHHKEVSELTGKISDLISPGLDEKKAADIRGLLSVLAGKLSIHLALEDKDLYPRMIAHEDKFVSSLARKYQLEMGEIADRFAQYTRKWPTPSAIHKNSGEFTAETESIFRSLSRRMDKEDNELYAAFDRLSSF